MESILPRRLLRRIISGGQTGVDRGALNAALAKGLLHGGWCPRGRRAEDGRIPDRYALRETESRRYAARTEQNVRDCDATLILCRGAMEGGTKLTRLLAARHDKPCLVIDLVQEPRPDEVLSWLHANQVETLNVAGPRESTCPGIAAQAEQFIARLIDLAAP